MSYLDKLLDIPMSEFRAAFEASAAALLRERGCPEQHIADSVAMAVMEGGDLLEAAGDRLMTRRLYVDTLEKSVGRAMNRLKTVH